MIVVLHKNNIKCRIYENDIETWVPDFNSNIQRKETITKITNFYSKIE